MKTLSTVECNNIAGGSINDLRKANAIVVGGIGIVAGAAIGFQNGYSAYGVFGGVWGAMIGAGVGGGIGAILGASVVTDDQIKNNPVYVMSYYL